MRIDHIQFFQFRNLHDGIISCGPGVNFLVGLNGQGKTNFVEAIHLLATARSFRTSSVEELSRWGAGECSVFSQITTEQKQQQADTYRIGIVVKKSSRTAYLDQEPLPSLSALLGRLLAVTFSPGDIALVKGAPALRRRFFDKHLVDCFPSVAPALFEAHHAVRLKSKVLKDKNPDLTALDTCDALIARHSVALAATRAEFVQRVQLRARLCLSEMTLQDGALNIRFVPSLGEELSVQQIAEHLGENRGREIRQRTCLFGPHRDEYVLELGGHDARSFASQGQSRSLVLALKLAMVDLIEEERGDLPVLILDDFESELDETRTATLLSEVRRTGRQVFVTGVSTPPQMLVGERPVRRFEVSQGQVITRDS